MSQQQYYYFTDENNPQFQSPMLVRQQQQFLSQPLHQGHQRQQSNTSLALSSTFGYKFLPQNVNLDKTYQPYNPIQIPPDWEIAENHGKASRVSEEVKGNKECICCGQTIIRKDIGLCESLETTICYLGEGYPLFYNWLIYSIYLLTILFVFFSIPAIMTNLASSYCKTPQTEKNRVCKPNFINNLSLVNKFKDYDRKFYQDLAGLVTTFIVLGFLINFRYNQRRINDNVDSNQSTPSDFTIMVKNLPLKIKNQSQYEAELKQFFERVGGPVCKINLAYNLKDANAIQAKIQSLVQQKKDILTQNDFDFTDPKYEKVVQDILNEEIKFQQLSLHYRRTNENFCGIAFVSFYEEKYKNSVIEKFNARYKKKKSLKKLLKDNLKENLSEIDKEHFKVNSHPNHQLLFHDTPLKVDVAPEPTAINWNVLHIPDQVVEKNTWIAFGQTILLGFACFFVVGCIKYYQSSIKYGLKSHQKEIEQYNLTNRVKKEIPEDQMYIVIWISILISVIITFFNKFYLSKVTMKIVLGQQLKLKNEKNTSYAEKQSSIAFYNAAFLVLVLHFLMGKKKLADEGGIIFIQYSVMVLNAILSPLWQIVYTEWLEKRYNRWNVEKKRQNGEGHKIALTQKEANELYEDPPYVTAGRYADLLKTTYLSFFYAPLIPLSVLWSLISFIIFYWVDKYNMLRRCVVKEGISLDLSVQMIELLEWNIMWFGIGLIIWDFMLFSFSWINLLILIIGIANMLLPMQSINEYFYPIPLNTEPDFYNQVETEFDSNYDRENPITQQIAIVEWYQRRDMALNKKRQQHKQLPPDLQQLVKSQYKQ